jgi:CelD/BcsL family acetyltransferase involved in cellulose biosynthesis
MEMESDFSAMKLKLLSPPHDFEQIAKIWQELSQEVGCAYFLSWGWIENWLACLPPDEQPQLAVIFKDNRTQAAFFIKKTTMHRHHLIKSRVWHINTVGKNRYDNVWIEYNQFLCRPFFAIPFVEILSALPEPWDEVWLPGLDSNFFPGNTIDKTKPYVSLIQDQSASPYVDLVKVRQKGDYLSLISSNTRSQIRRAGRLYTKTYGSIELEIADSLEAAFTIFDELVSLHSATWQKRQTISPFAAGYVQKFHKRLIEKRFEHGEIQLLRLRAGAHTVGILYNLVLKGRVYFYQSGMNYEADKRLKPGLVTHAEAISHNAASGNIIYDFLGGASRYKKSLATDEEQLIWVRIQKRRLKFAFENRLKALKNALFTD